MFISAKEDDKMDSRYNKVLCAKGLYGIVLLFVVFAVFVSVVNDNFN